MISKTQAGSGSDGPELQTVRGVLRILPEGYGFLKVEKSSLVPKPDEAYISPSQIRRYSLKTGDAIEGILRPPKEGEGFAAVLKIDFINGASAKSL